MQYAGKRRAQDADVRLGLRRGAAAPSEAGADPAPRRCPRDMRNVQPSRLNSISLRPDAPIASISVLISRESIARSRSGPSHATAESLDLRY